MAGGCRPGQRLLPHPAERLAGAASLRPVLPVPLQVRVAATWEAPAGLQQPRLQRQGPLQGSQAAVPVSGEEEVNRVVEAAKAAFATWSKTTG